MTSRSMSTSPSRRPMPTRRLPLAALLLAAACAPVHQTGLLSPVGARVTNEVLGQDAQAFDAWARRVDALRTTPQPPSADREYAVERAAAWLAYARDAYAFDPRDGAADAALGETRRVVLALERGEQPALNALPIATETQARPDLWAEMDHARQGPMADGAPVALAGAEVALVRAARLAESGRPGGRSMTDAERSCQIQQQVATAEQLVARLHAAPQQVAVVAQQGAPAPAPVVVAPVVAPVEKKYPVQRSVHFALNSSELSLPSRVTLGEVIAMLRAHPGVNLVISGFTDMRGDSVKNQALAMRRAEAVRHHLESAELALGRVTVAGVGTDSTGARSRSADAFARDRRVTLSFTDSDGQPLTMSSYQALGMDRERDLQVEQQKAQRRRVRTARGAAPSRPTHR